MIRPPPKKKMLFGLVFLASIQSISHFGLVIFMGPDKKYNPLFRFGLVIFMGPDKKYNP